MTRDTIFAPASGFGRAAIAVVRLSGPAVREALTSLTGSVPEPRRLVLRNVRDPDSGETVDQALVTYMPGPRSFTGEDQAEFHGHGGLAARAALMRVLGSVPGCRPAEAGEFTRRAFLNGRMDLTEVEGLADLIEAETDAQRRQALRQLEGRLGNLVEGWRERLIDALARLEAALDFADEGDVPEALEWEAGRIVTPVVAEMRAALASSRNGERLRDGFTVVIGGPPNAGKSTLLNAIARRDVAIVSPIAGTTRDAIEVRCDLGGLPVVLVDTAGLRETDDQVEQAGVARARSRLENADLVLWLVSPEGADDPPPNVPVLVVRTKADLDGSGTGLAISAATGAGLPDLIDRIAAAASEAIGAGDAVLTRERHRQGIKRATEQLERMGSALSAGHGELAAEDVRLALRALEAVTGRVDVEDVLDRLFSAFCIGK